MTSSSGPRARAGGAIFFGPHVLLPVDKARHVGEAVAMVVAETGPQAEQAADAVRVSWAPLPFVVDTAEAAEGRAHALWDAVSIFGHWHGFVHAVPKSVEHGQRTYQPRDARPRDQRRPLPPFVAVNSSAEAGSISTGTRRSRCASRQPHLPELSESEWTGRLTGSTAADRDRWA
jgi:CO/xanthine dehydrogenase Mo-binding subunit